MDYMYKMHASVSRRERKLTLADLEQWVDNDEGMYSWWRSSRQSKRQFVRDNRDELTAAVNAYLNQPPRS